MKHQSFFISTTQKSINAALQQPEHRRSNHKQGRRKKNSHNHDPHRDNPARNATIPTPLHTDPNLMNHAAAQRLGNQLRLIPRADTLPRLLDMLPNSRYRTATLIRNLFLGQPLAEKLRNPCLHTREFHKFSKKYDKPRIAVT
jgi:hypothetical protein